LATVCSCRSAACPPPGSGPNTGTKMRRYPSPSKRLRSGQALANRGRSTPTPPRRLPQPEGGTRDNRGPLPIPQEANPPRSSPPSTRPPRAPRRGGWVGRGRACRRPPTCGWSRRGRRAAARRGERPIPPRYPMGRAASAARSPCPPSDSLRAVTDYPEIRPVRVAYLRLPTIHGSAYNLRGVKAAEHPTLRTLTSENASSTHSGE
jgi:hypothetical protein